LIKLKKEEKEKKEMEFAKKVSRW